jgi:plastocyanin
MAPSPLPRKKEPDAWRCKRKFTNAWLDRAMLATMASAARAILLVALSTGAVGACSDRPLPEAADPVGPADAALVDPSRFEAIWPCPAEADYATGTDTVRFGFLGTPAAFVYDPKCLAVDAGDTVVFAGSFASHPLYPSGSRGTTTGNPIGGVSSGDREVILFPERGFFAYYCGIHGGADDGSTMAGVIWAR